MGYPKITGGMVEETSKGSREEEKIETQETKKRDKKKKRKRRYHRYRQIQTTVDCEQGMSLETLLCRWFSTSLDGMFTMPSRHLLGICSVSIFPYLCAPIPIYTLAILSPIDFLSIDYQILLSEG